MRLHFSRRSAEDDVIGLVRESINLQSLLEKPARPEDGAVVTFLGTVRDNARGHKVLRLEYHAYEPMALKKLQEVAAEARDRFRITDIAIVHRLGALEITDCSVAIAVSSPHRAAAFDACRYAIDTIKLVVPIWKKEYYEDGAAWIEGS
jgi:molybdopterin synthase catalytic subunit